MGQLHCYLLYCIMNSAATLVLMVVGLCLVTADPEPEANPGWSSGGYGGGVSHGHGGGGYSSGGSSFGGNSFGGHYGGGGHGGQISYVSRPVVTTRVVKVVRPVVIRRPVVTRRVVSSGYGGGHGGYSSGSYRRPISSGYRRPSYSKGHGW